MDSSGSIKTKSRFDYIMLENSTGDSMVDYEKYCSCASEDIHQIFDFAKHYCDPFGTGFFEKLELCIDTEVAIFSPYICKNGEVFEVHISIGTVFAIDQLTSYWVGEIFNTEEETGALHREKCSFPEFCYDFRFVFSDDFIVKENERVYPALSWVLTNFSHNRDCYSLIFSCSNIALMWTMLHEMAHGLLGHLDRIENTEHIDELSFLQSDLTPNELHKRRAEELEADIFASQHIIGFFCRKDAKRLLDLPKPLDTRTFAILQLCCAVPCCLIEKAFVANYGRHSIDFADYPSTYARLYGIFAATKHATVMNFAVHGALGTLSNNDLFEEVTFVDVAAAIVKNVCNVDGLLRVLQLYPLFPHELYEIKNGKSSVPISFKSGGITGLKYLEAIKEFSVSILLSTTPYTSTTENFLVKLSEYSWKKHVLYLFDNKHYPPISIEQVPYLVEEHFPTIYLHHYVANLRGASQQLSIDDIRELHTEAEAIVDAIMGIEQFDVYKYAGDGIVKTRDNVEIQTLVDPDTFFGL